jgi:PAS domain S-box-containing protein
MGISAAIIAPGGSVVTYMDIGLLTLVGLIGILWTRRIHRERDEAARTLANAVRDLTPSEEDDPAPAELEHLVDTVTGALARAESQKARLESATGMFWASREELEDHVRERTRELISTQNQYHELLDNLPVGVYRNTPGPRGRFIAANAAMLQMLGVDSLEDLQNQPVSSFYADPTDRTALSDLLSMHDQVISMPLKLRRKDGTEWWGSVTARVVRDRQGDIEAFDGVVEDITEKKLAARLRDESEQRFRAIVDHIRIGIAMIDRDMQVIAVNPQLSEWCPDIDPTTRSRCYEAMNISGRSVLCEGCPTARTLIDGGVHEQVIQTTREGEPRVLRVVSSPILDANGEPQAAIEMIEDITEQRQSEEAERTRQTLEASVRSMEQVLGVVSHELRTPLAAVRASAELLQELNTSDSSECGELLEGINMQARRMADMVSNLLEAARLQDGKAQWSWAVVDIDHVMADAVQTIEPLLNGKSIQIEVDCEHELIMRGDPNAIQRLAVNLLNNAIRHTTEGCIRISAVSEQDDHAWVRLSVDDPGEGIDPRKIEKLGQAFALSSASLGPDSISGTGLGLSICRAIVSAHGGQLLVSSRVGEGTCFTARMRADLSGPNLATQHEPIREVAA